LFTFEWSQSTSPTAIGREGPERVAGHLAVKLRNETYTLGCGDLDIGAVAAELGAALSYGFASAPASGGFVVCADADAVLVEVTQCADDVCLLFGDVNQASLHIDRRQFRLASAHLIRDVLQAAREAGARESAEIAFLKLTCAFVDLEEREGVPA
jgi:hypothetical protein